MNRFQKFLCIVYGHEKTDFFIVTTSLAPALFNPFSDLMDKKMVGAKKVVIIKISFFMPVNYTKDFLKSIHTSVVLS